MNILIYSENQLYIKGAVNKIVDELLTGLGEFRINVYIVAEYVNDIKYKYRNSITFKARKGRLRNLSHFLHLFLRLLFLKVKPDIIHIHQIGFSIVPIYYFSLIRKIPVIVTNHAYSDYNQSNLKDFNSEYYYGIKKYLLFSSTDLNRIYRNFSFVCLSRETKDELIKIGIDSSKLYHIPNGVKINNDIDYKNTKAKSEVSIIWVGRYDVFKDIKLALRTFYIINTKMPNAVLNILGVELNEINDEEKELANRLQNNIKFWGNIEDLSQHYLQSECLLMTSKSECMSLAMLEALSFGIPVVSTPVSGVTEVLTENDCGIVTNLFDENELANSVIKILNDKAIKFKMKNNAVKVIENKYNTTNLIKQHILMYNEIIKP